MVVLAVAPSWVGRPKGTAQNSQPVGTLMNLAGTEPKIRQCVRWRHLCSPYLHPDQPDRRGRAKELQALLVLRQTLILMQRDEGEAYAAAHCRRARQQGRHRHDMPPLA